MAITVSPLVAGKENVFGTFSRNMIHLYTSRMLFSGDDVSWLRAFRDDGERVCPPRRLQLRRQQL